MRAAGGGDAKSESSILQIKKVARQGSLFYLLGFEPVVFLKKEHLYQYRAE